MIASTTCRNSEDKLHFHCGIPMAIQANGVREQEGCEHTVTSAPHSFNPLGNWTPLRVTQGADFGVAAEKGLSF